MASHCTEATSTLKVPMIGVRATFRSVSLKVARNAAAAATAIIPIAARGGVCGAQSSSDEMTGRAVVTVIGSPSGCRGRTFNQ